MTHSLLCIVINSTIITLYILSYFKSGLNVLLDSVKFTRCEPENHGFVILCYTDQVERGQHGKHLKLSIINRCQNTAYWGRQ